MNEFAGTSISLPKNFQSDLHQYCRTRTEGKPNDPEDSPFPRMVDMWFMALCIAVKESIPPVLEKKSKTTDYYKVSDGNIFGSDSGSWRSVAIMLITISHEDNIEVVSDPHKMMRIANAYALAGLPRLISILEERGRDTALDHLSYEIDSMISK